MSKLDVLQREQVSQGNQQIFDQIKEQIGMVPNLYAVYAHSEVALQANLQLNQTLSQGEFDQREIEASMLAVSQENGCDYCLGAHTAIAQKAGFSEEETLGLRDGSIADPKLKALTDLARELTATRGRPAPETVERFFEAGYSKGALVELIGLVALNTFNNYTNHLAETPLDFPAAPALENVTA